MDRCPVCNKPKIMQLCWENGQNIYKSICSNPFCKENKDYNKNLEDFFSKLLGGKL